MKNENNTVFLTEDAISKLKYCAGCGQALDWSDNK